jgi:RNA-binding protein YhbY
MQKDKSKERVKRVIQGKPHVIIGKLGITDTVISEIKRRLKSEGVIKIRVLRTFLKASGQKTEDVANEVAKSIRSVAIADVRGNTFVIKKEKITEGVKSIPKSNKAKRGKPKAR